MALVFGGYGFVEIGGGSFEGTGMDVGEDRDSLSEEVGGGEANEAL
jgi:hypothetical protein